MKPFTAKDRSVGRRLVRIFLGVAAGLILLSGGLWILVRSLGDREKRYEGKSIYYWSEQIKSSNAAISNEAFLVLNREIIPHLTKTMFQNTNDSRIRAALVEALNGLPGINIAFTPADGRRSGAARAFGEFGPAAQGALPVLLRALQGSDNSVRGAAAVSLGKIHADADVVIPLLIKCLEEEDVREQAAEALGDFGSLSKAAVPKLLSLFTIPDKELHYAVETALHNIDPDALVQARAQPQKSGTK